MRRLLALVLSFSLVGLAHGASHRLRKPVHGFQARMHDFTVKPSEDLEVCEYRRLPNKKPLDIVGFKLSMPPEAHHFVIWSYGGHLTDDSKFPQGPVESVGCAGVSPDEAIPQVLIPIQTPNARFRFPEGIALRVEAHKQVWLNPHLRNYTDEAIRPDIRFNFYKAKKGTIRHLAQGLIIGNSTDIDVPAGGDQTLTAEWTSPIDLTLIQLATHQHQLGTYANIQILDPDGRQHPPIYENADWQHPYPFWPEGGIRLVRGQKMRITCTWHNPHDHAVRFGPETTDEMCFILGFYYRDDGDTTPVAGNGCLPSKSGLLCILAPKATP